MTETSEFNLVSETTVKSNTSDHTSDTENGIGKSTKTHTNYKWY